MLRRERALKRKRQKRIFSLILIAAMLLTIIIPTSAVADGGDEFTLKDDVINSGNIEINPLCSENHEDYVYTWYRSEDNSGDESKWTKIERKRVSGNQYNLSEDGRKLNAALDFKLAGTEKERFWYKVKAAAPDGTETESVPVQVGYYSSLQNGSFETPEVTGNKGYNQWDYVASPELMWKTTAQDSKIEVYNSTGFRFYGINRVPDGSQAAEINSSYYGALYQDLLTIPGSTMYWNLYHARRNSGGPDVMAVIMMSSKEAKNYETQEALDGILGKFGVNNDAFQNGYYDEDGNRIEDEKADGAYIYIAKCSTMKEEGWKYYSGVFKVPSDQYLTRFFFVSLEATSGGSGNLIDGISFSRSVPAPNPGRGNLEVKKTVTGLSEEVIKGYSLKATLSDDDEGTTDLTHTITEWTPVEGLANTFEGSTVFTGLPVSKDGKASTYKLTEEASGVDSEKYVLMDSSITSCSMSLEEGKTTSAKLKNEYECLEADAEFKKIWSGEGSLDAAKSISIAMTGNAGENTVSYTGIVTAGGGTLAKSDDATEVINMGVVTEGSSWNIKVKNLPKYASSAEEVAAGNGKTYTWGVEEKQVNGVTFALKNGKMTAAEEGVGKWVQTAEVQEGVTTITNTLTSNSDPTPPIGPIAPITPGEQDKPDEPGTEEPESPGGTEDPGTLGDTDEPGEPDNPKNPGNADASESPDDHDKSGAGAVEGNIPKTGDMSNLLIYALMIAGSMMGMTALIRRLCAKGENGPFL